MSADARNHLLLWLDHNIDLARRQFDGDQRALENRLAARGLFYSGGHIKEAIALAAQSVRTLTKPAFDKAGTLPEVADGNVLTLEKLKAYATSLVEATDAMIAKIEGSGPTSPGLWRAARELQAPILTDIEMAATLAAFGNGQDYRLPSTAGWNHLESAAAKTTKSPLPLTMTIKQAALWIAYRDESMFADSRATLEFRAEEEGTSAYTVLGAALIERSMVAFGLTAGEGWRAIPAEQFQSPQQVTLEPSPLAAYWNIYVLRPDMLALFPPVGQPANGQSKTSPDDELAAAQAAIERRKPLPDALLNGWWLALGSGRDSVPLGDLWAAAKAAHPKFHISRARVRRIAGARKRGPKGSAEN